MILDDVWILTPAPAHRLQDVTECHDYAGIPHDRRVIVTNPPNSILPGRNVKGHLIDTGDPDLNISKWWNAGLDFIRSQYSSITREYQTYHIMIAESDIRISASDVQQLSQALTRFRAGIAGANWRNLNLKAGEYLYSENNRHWGADETWRFPGVGFMVDGSMGLRFDEEFRWWFADDDFIFQHRLASNSVLVGGTQMSHAGGTAMDDNRVRMASEDHAKFLKKWGLDAY